MRLLALVSLFASAAFAQAATHSVTLNWTDPSNPAGTNYTVYRAQGLCSGSPVFAKIAAAVSTKTYVDTSISPGNWCYQVTATAPQGIESGPSPTALASVPTFAPPQLQIAVQ